MHATAGAAVPHAEAAVAAARAVLDVFPGAPNHFFCFSRQKVIGEYYSLSHRLQDVVSDWPTQGYAVRKGTSFRHNSLAWVRVRVSFFG